MPIARSKGLWAPLFQHRAEKSSLNDVLPPALPSFLLQKLAMVIQTIRPRLQMAHTPTGGVLRGKIKGEQNLKDKELGNRNCDDWPDFASLLSAIVMKLPWPMDASLRGCLFLFA